MADERVRIRLGPGKTMEAPAHLPQRDAPNTAPSAPSPVAAPVAATQPASLRPGPGSTHAQTSRWTGRPLVALVEAFASGADDLALTLMRLADAGGQRVALIGLDQQNRLGMRLGSPASSHACAWGENAQAQVRAAGNHWLLPAPDREEGLDPERLTALLTWVGNEVDATVVDLGCRWEPRLFRPVLQMATHIWVVCRSDKGMAMEMRLEQADFSGWTDMRRLRPVVLGETRAAGAVSWGTGTVMLPDGSGGPAQSFILRELGGSVR